MTSEARPGPAASTEAEMEDALAALDAHKGQWARLDVQRRIAIIDELHRGMEGVAERWIRASLEAKGLAPGSYAEGEEWLVLGVVFRLLRLLRASLVDIASTGRPRVPKVGRRGDGQVVAQVFPASVWDRALFAGTRAEVWAAPGVDEAALREGLARRYRERDGQGRVALVLGAGNVSALAVADVLHKLFVEGAVVVLKMNPVNDYLGPLIAEAFDALARQGFLRIVHGGAREGSFLVDHARVEELHLTGSTQSFEAIVFGPGEAGAERKRARAPRITKPFTAELGNISPVIVVPGPWSGEEIREMAGRIAGWFVNNAGFNCLTPRVLVQWRGWEHRQDLIRALGEALSAVPPRKAYYPGAQQRHAEFLSAHPEASCHGRPTAEQLPWTLIADVPPTRSDDICFRTESFCSIMAETALEAESVPAFLERAVGFANDVLWGTLSASLIVHPASVKERAVSTAVEEAIARLRYGTVCVNSYGGLAYFFGVTSWGAFPGHDIYDVQSGLGTVNNTFMIDAPQKSVVRSPFHQAPDPAKLGSKRFHRFGRALAELEASPSPRKVAGLLWHVVRS